MKWPRLVFGETERERELAKRHQELRRLLDAAECERDEARDRAKAAESEWSNAQRLAKQTGEELAAAKSSDERAWKAAENERSRREDAEDRLKDVQSDLDDLKGVMVAAQQAHQEDAEELRRLLRDAVEKSVVLESRVERLTANFEDRNRRLAASEKERQELHTAVVHWRTLSRALRDVNADLDRKLNGTEEPETASRPLQTNPASTSTMTLVG